MENKKITAIDLVDQFQDLLSLSPIEKWTTIEFFENPPRYFRLKRLESISKAFGIDNVKELYDGAFLEKKECAFELIREYMIKEVKPLIEPKAYEEWLNTLYVRETHGYQVYGSTLRMIYSTLMRYRTSLEDLLTSNSGVLAAGSFFRYPLLITKSLNSHIRENLLQKINEPLALIISPGKNKFTIEQLARDFNYPSVDLNKIDIENY